MRLIFEQVKLPKFLTRMHIIHFMALETEMRYASTPRMALENASIKSCLRIDGTDTQALNDRIAELEKRIDDMLKNPAGRAAAVQMPVQEAKPDRQQPKEEKKIPHTAGKENGGNGKMHYGFPQFHRFAQVVFSRASWSSFSQVRCRYGTARSSVSNQ